VIYARITGDALPNQPSAFNFRDLQLGNRIALSRPRMHWKSALADQARRCRSTRNVQGSGIVADWIDAAPARCWLLRFSRRSVVSIH